jgi:electron transport complex protein RnfD
VASLSDLFWGNVGGCLGETSAFALLLGGLFLLARKLIKWQVPATFIGTVALISAIAHHVRPELTPPALYHVLAGGLMIGAFFMATDMVTSPMTTRGALIFGGGCGVITAVIRIWGGYPEGVSFSILFMNALTPLIDRFTVGKPFGYVPPRKGGESAK